MQVWIINGCAPLIEEKYVATEIQFINDKCKLFYKY